MKKDSTPLFHISRNFVEFGAFTALEVASFRERGILSDHDYVRSAGSHDWLTVAAWLASVAPAIPGSKSPAKPAARKRGTPGAKASKKAA